MLLKIIRFLRGSVDFTASGNFPGKIYEHNRKKRCESLESRSEKERNISLNVLSDYKKTEFLHADQWLKQEYSKHGLPFINYRYKKRTGLFAGAVCGIILCIFLSNFIWSVKISGTEEISNTYLESLLGDNGNFCRCVEKQSRYRSDRTQYSAEM